MPRNFWRPLLRNAGVLSQEYSSLESARNIHQILIVVCTVIAFFSVSIEKEDTTNLKTLDRIINLQNAIEVFCNTAEVVNDKNVVVLNGSQIFKTLISKKLIIINGLVSWIPSRNKDYHGDVNKHFEINLIDLLARNNGLPAEKLRIRRKGDSDIRGDFLTFFRNMTLGESRFKVWA